MDATVIDASVAVKWVVPESHSEAAERLLSRGTRLHAPGHWLAEATTALWAKCVIGNVLTQHQAMAAIRLITDVTVDETPTRHLIGSASQIAFQLRLTIYDTLY